MKTTLWTVWVICFVILVSGMASGCAKARVELPDGSIATARRTMIQVGIIKSFVNNCAPMVEIWSVYGKEVPYLAYGRSATLPIPSIAYSGGSRQISVTIKAFADDLATQYIGSLTFQEYVSIYEGTRDAGTLQIDRLESPRGARCPSEARP